MGWLLNQVRIMVEKSAFSKTVFSETFLLSERKAYDYFYDHYAAVIYGLIFSEAISVDVALNVFKNTILTLWRELKDPQNFPEFTAIKVISTTRKNMLQYS